MRDLAVSETISFVGVVDGALVGHAVFTPCGIQGTSARVALLGPVAVAPDMQGKGLGSTLIRAGLQQLAGAGTVRVYVLGDPACYGRFGFASDDDVAPPYPLPEEWRGAWQSLRLVDDATPLEGTLTVPEVWRQEALWLP